MKTLLLPLLTILLIVSCTKKSEDKILADSAKDQAAIASTVQKLSTVDPIVQSIIYGMIEDKGVDLTQIVPEANFDFDLGFDHLDKIELIRAVEQEFNIDIADEDAEQLNTVGDLVAYVSAIATGSNQSETQYYDIVSESGYSSDDLDYSFGGQAQYVPISYSTQANIKYVSMGPSTTKGDIVSVYVFPLTITNTSAFYKDSYGRNVTRSLTIFGTNPPTSYSLISSKSVMLSWYGLVNAQYTYYNFDGTTQHRSRQWSKSYTKLASYPAFQ